GGFVAGGVDGDGPWLERVPTDATLAAELKRLRAPMAWQRAVRIALDIAEALATCEREAIEGGALSPDSVLLADERAHFAAELLIEQVLGVAARPTGSLSPIWCPPAQADGAPFDHAANRYVLGLILYKMLSGSHPFSGAGLRRALEAAASSEPPPFASELANALPPGLQALTLRLLSPDGARRPESGDVVADALSRFAGQTAAAGNLDIGLLGGPDELAAPTERTPERDIVPPTERTVGEREAPAPRGGGGDRPRRSSSDGAGRTAWLRMLMPIALGAAVAVAAVSQLEPEKQAPKASYDIDGPPPLTAKNTEASDCASCHARQVSEWRRSVMGHSVKSPLFNGLESLIQEQVGRDFDCPNGAGILRKTNNQVACRDPQSGLAVSGSGGEHWCVNCHSPGENLDARMPVWEGRLGGNPQSRLPVRDILDARGMEGISCGFCHQVHGPVNPRSRGYQGNPTWTSFVTGQVFQARPEDRASLFGIANSGYLLDSASFISSSKGGGLVPHKLHDEAQTRYLRSSEFCGSCHDVRLFGTDVLGARKGEQF
ncbi:MAG: hypothetical protein JNK04_09725, partial [Myxococcales bacterium]|nr:hypothetical protein [Myxococcales bacterium]